MDLRIIGLIVYLIILVIGIIVWACIKTGSDYDDALGIPEPKNEK